jgi:TatD DNase family protein
MWIDSHCHLNHESVAQDETSDAIVGRAHEAGIKGMLNICCRIVEEFDAVLATTQQYDDVWCSVGTHPHDAGREDEQNVSEDHIIARAMSDANIIAIGESGLDYHYDNSPREAQQRSFRKHIRACMRTDMPLIVHAREADNDIIRIIREETQGEPINGVMHCFSSTPEMGRQALEMGFYISFSGILTFKKSQELRDFAREVPTDKLLVETDSPFLAPEPYRGKRNEPALVGYTGRKLAELKNMSEEEMASICNQNFFDLFPRARQLA